MKKFYSYALGACLTLLMASCEKDDVTPDGPKLTAKETLLTSKKWRITAIEGAITVDDFTSTFDAFARLPACQRDNFATFNADKTGISDEGTLKCSTTDPQTQNFTWALNADETTLTASGFINGSATAVTADLLQLTSTTMQIRTTTTQTQAGIVIKSSLLTTYAPQ